MRPSLAVIGFSTALIALTATRAIGDNRIDQIGHWGGTIASLAVQSDIAYVGVGPRLVILDVHDPTRPVRLGQTEPLGHVVVDVAAEGNFAYVAACRAGMKIVDVSNPSAPRLVSSVSSPLRPPPYNSPDGALAIASVGTNVLVFYEYAGLRVYDVSDPENPHEVGTFQVQGRLPIGLDMAVRDDVAYILTWVRVTLVDVSEPDNPGYLSEFDLDNWARAIEVDDEHAYVAEHALAIFDISNPHAPTFVTRIGDNPWTDGGQVALAQGRTYLHDDSPGLSVIDTTDPSQPIWRGTLPMDSTLGGAIAAAGSRAYAGDWYSELRVVEATDPDHPTQVGSYDEVAHSQFLSTDGDLLLSVGYTPGVQVLNVSDPRSPRRVAQWGDRRMQAAMLRGQTAYLGDRGLTILDVSTLNEPALIGRIDLDDSVSGEFAIAHGCAYLGTYTGGFTIVDIHNPENPQLLTTAENGPSYGVVVRGDRAYVATYDHGLQIYDISFPTLPLLLGEAPETGATYCVALVGDLAYVAGNNGVRLVDVSDSTSPYPVPLSLPGYWGQIWRLVQYGHYLLVPLDQELRLLDISDPQMPRLVATYTAQGWGTGAAVANGAVFLATREGGIEALAIRAPGDLDGDDDVDVQDLAEFLAAFGSCESDALFNPYADVDSNDCVGLPDLASLLSAFGQ